MVFTAVLEGEGKVSIHLFVKILSTGEKNSNGLQHCIRKPQVWEFSRLCPETSTKLCVHEFGFRLRVLLRVLKNKSVLFVWALRVFTIICCLSVVKIIIKFRRSSITSLPNFKIFPVSLFRKLVLPLRPLWHKKFVLKAASNSENCSSSSIIY